ncbi:hypothetical protein KDN24_07055 [Bacillus sp. Bva_UNVM-123]|uniref:hypothetical protein n=1 Tax=Bacillus sp. Bva_UNVM-123 TaxID=2829798 RepID=UPI00391F79A3
MENQICMICDKLNIGEKWNVQIRDDKSSVIITGHKDCIDNIDNEIKRIEKNSKKITLKKILKEIGLNLEF